MQRLHAWGARNLSGFLQPLGRRIWSIAIKPRDRSNRQVRDNRSDASLQDVPADVRDAARIPSRTVRLRPSDIKVIFEGGTKMAKMSRAARAIFGTFE